MKLGKNTALLLLYKHRQEHIAREDTATEHRFPYCTDHNLPNKQLACRESGQLDFVTALEIAALVWRAIFMLLSHGDFLLKRMAISC